MLKTNKHGKPMCALFRKKHRCIQLSSCFIKICHLYVSAMKVFLLLLFSQVFFSPSRYNNRGIIHCNFDCLSHCRCGHFVSKSNHGVITITRLVAKQHSLCLPSHHDWYSYFQLKMELKALLFNEYLIMQGVTFL